ncbi:hypothetical protein TNIN_277951 [Trichonephila inaurata madagascariensis]|uniref:Uncharacterized protein n=1 Tax=Trichonephila inaurata madagascariensis TaxID=2747483 RepID=A0A8X7C6D7_9ARAC|nr:hypothetical protein TNIN_73131 [Trichonephila inaurata madagascariensis]GFY55769.1 hypothetical protein TNIN_277951 [Trichonephila inaurata madagascariensis]
MSLCCLQTCRVYVRSKNSPEEFVLPKKTASPDSPAKAPTNVETNNSFSDLEQDEERPVPENVDFPEEIVDKLDPNQVI